MAKREEILEATIDVFRDKGMKFTMDELAKNLSISKKTIYTFFPDKKTLFLEMTDYIFDQIKQKERAIYENPELSTLEKFEQILIVLPDRFSDYDLHKMQDLRLDYPEIYEQIASRLDAGWDLTIDLYEKAVAEGKLRRVEISMLKAVLEGTIHHLLSYEPLSNEEYKNCLEEMVDLLLHGMQVKENVL